MCVLELDKSIKTICLPVNIFLCVWKYDWSLFRSSVTLWLDDVLESMNLNSMFKDYIPYKSVSLKVFS